MQQELINKINNLFFDFEETKFKNNTGFGWHTNLVFEFCDYVFSMSNMELVELMSLDNELQAQDIKLEVEKGTQIWLKQNAKTLAIL